MKKRIQKYLAGEREGFSLVELIIVIAIMAILIGVIALAVIPNIQRSRESKDLTTLDSVISGLNVAVANTKLSGNISATTISSVLSGTDPTGAPTGFAKEVQNNLGTTAPTLSSAAAQKATGSDIYFSITKPTGSDKMTIKVWAGTSTAVNDTDYDKNEASKFEVSN